MTVITLHGEPPIDVKLRRSARAKRMTLRVSRLDGKVTLTVPRHASERDALQFSRERQDWIRSHLSKAVASHMVGLGDSLPVLGKSRTIAAGNGRRIVLKDDVILVPGDATKVGRKLKAWLKETARSELVFASDHYAKALGKPYQKITLRDTRSRWGSCTTDGKLMYSWRLIMAPAEVLAYVAAHEVAHLAEMNHSAAFWSTLEEIHGDYKAAKSWLRKEGHALHSYRFEH